MSINSAMRSYTGVFQYPSKKPFRVGNIFVSINANFHEVEEQLIRLFEEKFRSILPEDFPSPQLVNFEAGQIWFESEATQ